MTSSAATKERKAVLRTALKSLARGSENRQTKPLADVSGACSVAKHAEKAAFA